MFILINVRLWSTLRTLRTGVRLSDDGPFESHEIPSAIGNGVIYSAKNHKKSFNSNKMLETISNIVVNTVPADDVAPLVPETYLYAVMARFGCPDVRDRHFSRQCPYTGNVRLIVQFILLMACRAIDLGGSSWGVINVVSNDKSTSI